MKKRKILLEDRINKVYSNDKIKISREGDEWFFEIGNQVTTDIAEAVSILMRKCEPKDKVWEMIVKDITTNEITPSKSLFWLTGGPIEWKTLENYNMSWTECYSYFQEEYGLLIITLVEDSNTLGEIRDSFLKYLDLATLYEFSLSKKLIR